MSGLVTTCVSLSHFHPDRHSKRLSKAIKWPIRHCVWGGGVYTLGVKSRTLSAPKLCWERKGPHWLSGQTGFPWVGGPAVKWERIRQRQKQVVGQAGRQLNRHKWVTLLGPQFTDFAETQSWCCVLLKIENRRHLLKTRGRHKKKFSMLGHTKNSLEQSIVTTNKSLISQKGLVALVDGYYTTTSVK